MAPPEGSPSTGAQQGAQPINADNEVTDLQLYNDPHAQPVPTMNVPTQAVVPRGGINWMLNGQTYEIRSTIDGNWALVAFPPELALQHCTAFQRTVAVLPAARLVCVRWLSINWQQVMRPSYINAFLIYTRGVQQAMPCQRCAVQMTANEDGRARPFPDCIAMTVGHWTNQCANCKWTDHGKDCSLFAVRPATPPRQIVPALLASPVLKAETIIKKEDQGRVFNLDSDDEDNNDGQDEVGNLINDADQGRTFIIEDSDNEQPDEIDEEEYDEIIISPQAARLMNQASENTKKQDICEISESD